MFYGMHLRDHILDVSVEVKRMTPGILSFSFTEGFKSAGIGSAKFTGFSEKYRDTKKKH